VVELVFAILEHVKSAVTETAVAFELTPQQAFLLHVLDQPCRMRDLAEVLRCDPSNVTGLVDRAERRDLVRRESDPDDRRSKRLLLTDHGRKVRAELQQRVLALPLTAGLSDQQAEQLCELLATVVASLRSKAAIERRPTELAAGCAKVVGAGD
jgi:DNA-binding MarR family transcriptional regulator